MAEIIRNNKQAKMADIMDDSYIKIEHVTMSFGEAKAVDDACLEAARGSVFGLVGSDGAGKSTLLRMLATMIKPSEGRMKIAGLDVVADKRKVKEIIGYMPQRFGLYQDLTVLENINFFMNIFGIRGQERKSRMEKYLGFSNLLPYLDRQAGNLSGGMKQKLGLACVLVHEPDVLILDEPTNGVDPVSRQEFWDILNEMKRQGKTIIISTAYLDEGEKCDTLAMMHKSKVLQVATPADIQARYASLEDAMIMRIAEIDGEIAGDDIRR